MGEGHRQHPDMEAAPREKMFLQFGPTNRVPQTVRNFGMGCLAPYPMGGRARPGSNQVAMVPKHSSLLVSFSYSVFD